MANEYKTNPNPRSPMNEGPQRPGWTIPAVIAGIVLAAGMMIFWAAGPDRSRTAEFNTPNSNRTTIEKSQPAESAIPAPSQDAPRTAPAPTVPQQKSNPAGTQ